MRWNIDFLQQDHTIRNIDRDFREWHQGREYYAIWAIEINAPSWQACLKKARQHMQDYLLPGTPRCAHITLFTLGFVDDLHYQRNIQRQIQAINEAELQPFELELGAINSFSSAPYFNVLDPEAGLEKIRTRLATSQYEDRFAPYTPHLTIGLYNNEYPCREIRSVMSALDPLPTETIRVNKISLMHYATSSIMSPLMTQQQLHF